MYIKTIKITVYSTIFRNTQEKYSFNQPKKEQKSQGLSNNYEQKSGFRDRELSEQKYKTLYGFNMNNSKPSTYNYNTYNSNYHYKKNKENYYSQSPNQKLKESLSSSTQGIGGLGGGMGSIGGGQLQNNLNSGNSNNNGQPTYLPNVKGSIDGKKNSNIPQNLIQEKIANKNEFFSKLNEMTSMINGKMKSGIVNSNNSSTNDSTSTNNTTYVGSFQGSNKKNEKEAVKHLKPRKFGGNANFNETTTSPFNPNNSININNLSTSSVNNYINNYSINGKKYGEDSGITSFTSQQNVNPNIQVYSCRSRAGNQPDGSRKTNQDSYLAKTQLLNLDEYCVFGVYDGHGKTYILLYLFRN